MDEGQFINMYIQNLVKEVEELTKTKIVLDTKLQFVEATNAELVTQAQELATGTESRDREIELWKNNATTLEDRTVKLENELADLKTALNQARVEVEVLKKTTRPVELVKNQVVKRRGNAKDKEIVLSAK
jgi:chromosome segregation ATPase